MTERYVPNGRLPKTIPAGQKLAHNHVRHDKNTQAGVGGFRAWFTDKLPDGFVPCDCGWSGLPHFALAPKRLRSTTGRRVVILGKGATQAEIQEALKRLYGK